jgi:hypothetical protein
MRWTLPALLLTATLSPAAGPMQSASCLAFGPDGTLFVGDSQAGAVLAVKTGDTAPAGQGDVTVENLSEKLSKLFGTPDVAVADLKVNPASGNLFLAVKLGTGKDQTPALAKLTRTGELTKFEPKDVTACKLTNAKVDPKAPRQEAITYLGFADGKLMVAGLSTEEFASTFRVLPVPLPAETKDGTGIEIYHAAHGGALETRAPIRAFVPYTAGGVQYVMASYTCTPLVRLAASDLQPGKKVKGTTIAELGNRNQPLDLISYTKGGKEFLLMSNSARGVMKIPADPVAAAEALTKPVTGGGTAGVPFEKVTQLEGVVQLDKLDADRAVVVVQAGKVLSVKTVPLP